jgi:hypothetical protein
VPPVVPGWGAMSPPAPHGEMGRLRQRVRGEGPGRGSVRARRARGGSQAGERVRANGRCGCTGDGRGVGPGWRTRWPLRNGILSRSLEPLPLWRCGLHEGGSNGRVVAVRLIGDLVRFVGDVDRAEDLAQEPATSAPRESATYLVRTMWAACSDGACCVHL